MCSKSLVILKICTVKTMRYYALPIRLAKLESLIMPSVGKHEGHRKPPALLVGLLTSVAILQSK